VKIIETQKYKQELRQISFYIKKDKLSAAINFVSQLKEVINNIPNFPYKYRKSIYFQNESIRDMTFKSYTIVYEISEKYIEIMTIFNQNKPKS